MPREAAAPLGEVGADIGWKMVSVSSPAGALEERSIGRPQQLVSNQEPPRRRGKSGATLPAIAKRMDEVIMHRRIPQER